MQYLHIHFYILRHRIRKDGKAPIYMRITVNGKRKEFSTSRAIEPKRWDSKTNRVKGRKPDARSINRHLEQMKQDVYAAQKELKIESQEVTAEKIKAKMTGEDEKKKTVKEVFKIHNEKMKSLIGKDFAEATYKKYRTAFKHIKNFLRKEYKIDLPITEVDINFLEDFEYYLKTEKNCCHNSAKKYLSNFQKIINLARKRGWLEDDPFLHYDIKYKKKDPVFLTNDELQKIEQKQFDIKRLDRVRDIFVFSCYTALSFVDAEKLKKTSINEDKDGNKYIYQPRTKTGQNSRIFLMDKPLQIINKYKDDPETEDGSLLPMISNQKTNAYLKEIAALCGITKKLTHHVARHTCATTVLLTNGVSMSTVQNILGHARISTTKHYARVLPNKVIAEVKAVNDKLSASPE